jgi:hypothetical protein
MLRSIFDQTERMIERGPADRLDRVNFVKNEDAQFCQTLTALVTCCVSLAVVETP